MKKIIFSAFFFLFSLSGCEKEPPQMPAATKENCNNKELISSLDEKTRGEFVGDCIAHATKETKRPSNPKTW